MADLVKHSKLMPHKKVEGEKRKQNMKLPVFDGVCNCGYLHANLENVSFYPPYGLQPAEIIG